MSGSDNVLLAVFYSFNMTGQILLILFLLTVSLSRLNRDLTLVNVVVSMVIFSTACLLLLYAHEYRGPEPRFGLCLMQASLIYGSLAMGATGIFCLFFQLWESVHNASNIARNAEKLRVLLRLIPWLAFIGMFITSVIDGTKRKSEVRLARDFFYCSASSTVGYTSCIICGVFMISSVVLEVHIVFSLFRAWRLRTLRKDLLPLDLMIRLGIFSIYGALCVTVAVVFIWFSTDGLPRYPFIFMSTLPLAIWAVFGTQKDVMRIWTCRGRDNFTSIGSGRSSSGRSTADHASKALAQPSTMLTNPYSSFMMNETLFSPTSPAQGDALEHAGSEQQHRTVDIERGSALP